MNSISNHDETILPVQTSVCDAPFYSTIPSHQHIEQVLELQKRYVDKLLSIASEYSNIIISINKVPNAQHQVTN